MISQDQHTDWLISHPEDFRGGGEAFTEAAHIIPESTNYNISEGSKKVRYVCRSLPRWPHIF